jgi:hypothetical protein
MVKAGDCGADHSRLQMLSFDNLFKITGHGVARQIHMNAKRLGCTSLRLVEGEGLIGEWVFWLSGPIVDVFF